MPYQIIVRQPGHKIRWRDIIEDIARYPRSTRNGDRVELRSGTIIDLSHSQRISGDETEELRLYIAFKDDSESAADAMFDIARSVGKKYGVQFWHEDFGLDYATATEREIVEAFDGEAPEEGGG